MTMRNLMWNRRQFGLFTGAALLASTAGCAAGGEEESAIIPPAKSTITKLGIQLYTIRDSFAADPLAAMQAVADAGFAEVEFGGGGFFARDPAQLRGFLDQTGLAAPSMHCTADELSTQMDRVILMAKTVGAAHVVLPWVPEEMRGSVEAWQKVAALCASSAERLAGEGIAFAYHNHEFEFDKVDGDRTGLDILAAETDAQAVKLELDLYWAAAAGQDISALFQQHSGRISLVHVKDVAEDGLMTLPGEGSLDFQAIFRQAKLAGIEHFFVENDRLITVDEARLKAAADHLLGMEIS